MKSRTLFYGVLALFLLTGCAKNPPSFQDRLRAGSETIEGVIQPLEQINIYQGGTHQLQTDRGEFIRIQSATLSLNRYLEKEVRLTGEFEAVLGNSEPVFSVQFIKVIGEEPNLIKRYENKRFGFSFNYSSVWEILEEAERVVLSEAGQTIIQIDIFSSPVSLETFLEIQGEGERIPVTVGISPGLRVQDEQSTRFYVSNVSKQKLYRIEFKTGKEPEPLFNWLSTFTLIQSQRPQGKRCGGPARLACDPGYRCELYSTEKESGGVCIPLVETPEEPTCPLIAIPTNCIEYEPADLSLNGCPTRYRCSEQPPEESLELEEE